jgi:hypothetical protein
MFERKMKCFNSDVFVQKTISRFCATPKRNNYFKYTQMAKTAFLGKKNDKMTLVTNERANTIQVWHVTFAIIRGVKAYFIVV